jgi:predicted RNA-binding protein with PUA-like domain
MGKLRSYWLMKSEPSVFSIDDLRSSKTGTSYWEGVRNYQARNFLRDKLKVGDGVLFYHSNEEPVGIAGEAVVVKEGYPDFTAFDPKSLYFDPKSKPKEPTWFMVDVKFVRKSREVITLKMLREISALQKMMALQKGSRLSIQPVTSQEWRVIMKLF